MDGSLGTIFYISKSTKRQNIQTVKCLNLYVHYFVNYRKLKMELQLLQWQKIQRVSKKMWKVIREQKSPTGEFFSLERIGGKNHQDLLQGMELIRARTRIWQQNAFNVVGKVACCVQVCNLSVVFQWNCHYLLVCSLIIVLEDKPHSKFTFNLIKAPRNITVLKKYNVFSTTRI